MQEITSGCLRLTRRTNMLGYVMWRSAGKQSRGHVQLA